MRFTHFRFVLACIGVVALAGRSYQLGRMAQKFEDDAKLQQCNKIVYGGGK